MTASVLFGLATRYPYAVAARSLSGLLNGTVGVSKTYLGEICDSTNVARAFSWIGLMWGFGSIAGSVFGGLLARPAVQYPKVFSKDGIFGTHPYLIPNLVAAIVTCTGFILCFFFLTENEKKSHQPAAKEIALRDKLGLQEDSQTEESEKENQRDEDLVSLDSGLELETIDTEDKEDDKIAVELESLPFDSNESLEAIANDSEKGIRPIQKRVTFDVEGCDGGEGEINREFYKNPILNTSFGSFATVAAIQDRHLPWYRRGWIGKVTALPAYVKSLPIFQEWPPVLACIIYALYGACQTMADEIWPLWALTPVADGGLAFKTDLIGICNAWAGSVQLLFNLLLYPIIARRFGFVKSFWMGAIASAAIYSIYPTIALIPLPQKGDIFSYVRFWFVLGTVALIKQCSAQLGFSAVMTMISNSVFPETMGSANGLGQSLVAFTRMLAPFTSAAVLALSMSSGMPFPFNRGRLAWWVVSTSCVIIFAFSTKLPFSLNKPRIEAEADKIAVLKASKLRIVVVSSSDNLLNEHSPSDDDTSSASSSSDEQKTQN